MEKLSCNASTSELGSKLALSLETKHLLKTPLSENFEQDLLNEVCIPSMLSMDLLQKGYKQ